jgi:hypothetical protein
MRHVSGIVMSRLKKSKHDFTKITVYNTEFQEPDE